MAGNSSRFIEAGYTLPKYKLPLAGKTVFEWVVLTFEKYFRTEHFKFIVQGKFEKDNFTIEKIRSLGILNYSIFELEQTTKGQAETVYRGILNEQDQNILIFNIDTIRRNFSIPQISENSQGFLEVFKGEGEHWSFVEPRENSNNFVKRTTEKDRISELCSNGMYYFKSSNIFKEFCEESILLNEYNKGELYIAPLYNKFIFKGYDIEFIETKLDDNIFCGVPHEYEYLLKNTHLLTR
jgi:NDP-sugar pyrophosphorylase family protein